ncbi:unnamed protein product, partial [Amoebophrya sp. A120]|eukprot:GSA120T00009881001.1
MRWTTRRVKRLLGPEVLLGGMNKIRTGIKTNLATSSTSKVIDLSDEEDADEEKAAPGQQDFYAAAAPSGASSSSSASDGAATASKTKNVPAVVGTSTGPRTTGRVVVFGQQEQNYNKQNPQMKMNQRPAGAQIRRHRLSGVQSSKVAHFRFARRSRSSVEFSRGEKKCFGTEKDRA